MTRRYRAVQMRHWEFEEDHSSPTLVWVDFELVFDVSGLRD